MLFNIKELFSEDSLFITRYNLTDKLVHKIQFFYECFRNYEKVGEDIEVIIPCVLLVLHVNNYKIDLVDEVRYLASVLFNESEMNRRQINIYNNFIIFADDYMERDGN